MKIAGDPQLLFKVKSLIEFQICYPQKIKNTMIMKICNENKILMLNVNLGSEISYDAI